MLARAIRHTAAVLALTAIATGCTSEKQALQGTTTTETPASTTSAQSASGPVTSAALIAGLSWDNPDGGETPVDGVGNGPWVDEIWVATAGADGIPTSTGKRILDHASAPTTMRLTDGTIILYGNDGTKRSTSGLIVAVSTDNGSTWKAGAVRFSGNVNPGANGHRGDPEAELLSDGRIRLYYMQPAPNGPVVKSAVTSDGITFVEESGDRVVGSGIDNHLEADVIQMKDKTWMMFMGDQPTKGSSDGVTFTALAGSSAGASHTNSVLLASGKIRQYRCDHNTLTTYVSSDGLTWTYEGAMAEDPTTINCDPAPLKLGTNSWLVAFKRQAKLAPPR